MNKKKMAKIEKDLEEWSKPADHISSEDEGETFADIARDIIELEDIGEELNVDFIRHNFCYFMQRIMDTGGCASLVNDDNGHWAIAGDGVQSVSCGRKPKDLNTTFFIKARDFSDTISGALIKWAKEVLKEETK